MKDDEKSGDLEVKGSIARPRRTLNDNVADAIAGSLAGVLTSFVATPLDVIKTRLQNQEVGDKYYRGLTGTVRTTWRDEGFRGFFRGLGPTMLGYLPSWGIYFAAYNQYKHTLCSLTSLKESHAGVHLTSAYMAGVTSNLFTQPFWVVKTRMMTQSNRSSYKYKSSFNAFATIIRVEGFPSLWKGFSASALGSTHVAIQLPVYEKLKVVLPNEFRLLLGEGDHTTLTILTASCASKMVACLITYPHEVVRTRLQTQIEPSATQAVKKYTGLWQTFKLIYKTESLRGFYKGLGAGLFRAVPSAAVTFLSYEMILRQLKQI